METDKTIWCYTGYTWEKLLAKHDPIVMSLLENLDVLVDGPFIQSLRNTDLHFRGSSNQRLIDVQKSLLAGEVILWQR
jgi:anaerobic ribonucleoside-triphosphate reductase activating protein